VFHRSNLALGVMLGVLLVATSARACEFGADPCVDRALLDAHNGDREAAEMDAITRRFNANNPLHCPPLDAMHPGRCDGMQDGPIIWGAAVRAQQRHLDELMALHARACRLGYAAYPGTCN
jgi:hypothetical protein